MFNIGDKVRVVDSDKTYTTYSDWVEYYAPRYIHLYNETAHVGVEGVGEIVHIAKHSNDDMLLYLVKGEARISLVEAEGLEEVESLAENPNGAAFNIGDEVTIIDDGKRYDLYTEWVAANAPEYLDDFSHKRHLSIGSVGIVKVIAKHSNRGVYLYLISNGDKATLISAEGIEHVGKETSVKQYKSWEVLKELAEDPEKEFVSSSDSKTIIRVGSDGCRVNLLGRQSFSIHEKWVELDKSVNFMEAFIAFREHKKDIRCVLYGEIHRFAANHVEEYSFGEELIDYGKWYII